MSKTRPQDSTESQTAKFEHLARELEADEDEARFEETVRKIAPKMPAQEADEEGPD